MVLNGGACKRLQGFHGMPVVAIAQLKLHVAPPHALRHSVILRQPDLGSTEEKRCVLKGNMLEMDEVY